MLDLLCAVELTLRSTDGTLCVFSPRMTTRQLVTDALATFCTSLPQFKFILSDYYNVTRLEGASINSLYFIMVEGLCAYKSLVRVCVCVCVFVCVRACVCVHVYVCVCVCVCV